MRTYAPSAAERRSEGRGNYSATIRAQHRAQAKGFTQVLWLDGVERNISKKSER
jgi:hypothetical protein